MVGPVSGSQANKLPAAVQDGFLSGKFVRRFQVEIFETPMKNILKIPRTGTLYVTITLSSNGMITTPKKYSLVHAKTETKQLNTV